MIIRVFLREHLFKNLNFLLSTTGKMRGGEERFDEEKHGGHVGS